MGVQILRILRYLSSSKFRICFGLGLLVMCSDFTNNIPNLLYPNDPKFLDRQVWANSVDPDQTAPTLFAIPSASFGCITLS